MENGEGLRVRNGGVSSSLQKTLGEGMRYTRKKAEYTAVRAKVHADGVMSTTKQVLYNAVATVLTMILIVSLAVFMYGTFYYAYMPLEMHEEPVFLNFVPCPDATGPCSFPNSTVHLHPKIKLMTGQPYSISLRLEVPDSQSNQGLGMFMSCLHIVNTNLAHVSNCKTAMLEFRSDLLRVMETFAYSPFFLTGTSTQRQWLTINYFRKFEDDPHNPANHLILQIQSKFIQVYGATLLIHAEFSGLRHIMYHHPWISTFTGVFSNIVILSLIILMSWTRFFTDDEMDQIDSGLVGNLKGEAVEKEEEDEIEILKKAAKHSVQSIK